MFHTVFFQPIFNLLIGFYNLIGDVGLAIILLTVILKLVLWPLTQKALQSQKIAGAGLDVFEKEPLPVDSPLWDMGNVIITPHYSGLSLRYMDRAVEILCKNLESYLKGRSLPNEVYKKLGY